MDKSSIMRSHVLIEYLKQWSKNPGIKKDENKYVTHAMKVYNTSVREGMKYTPHELVFVRSARIPTSSILSDDKSNESYSEYAITLFNRIFDTQASACENLEYAKIRSKQYYDHKANHIYLTRTIMYIPLLKEHWEANSINNIKGLIRF